MSFCTRPMVAAKIEVTRAHHGHHGEGFGRHRKHRVGAHDHVHAGGHHRRRVDQSADRRGTFHRVRQPNIQRKLRRLPCRADEQQQRNRRQRGVAHYKMSRRDGRADFRKLNRAERAQHQEEPKQKARVADAVDDERFLPRVRRRFAQEIKTDQQVAAQARRLPSRQTAAEDCSPVISVSIENMNRFR